MNSYEEELGIPNFDLAVNFGWFWFLAKPFFYLLYTFGGITGNMGVAIILMTVLVRGSVFPLTDLSYRSFAKIKLVAPQVAELRMAHKDDKKKLQEEIMKLYQENGVNPVAGCFPMLLQIPIFFALYKVLFVTIEIRHAPFFGWIQDLSAKDPTTIFNLFGLIPWTPPEFLIIGAWPCVMLVAMFIQKKLSPPPDDPIQRDMMNIFPFMITFIMSKFASGLVIYWAFSAIIGVIQQMIIMYRMGVPIHILGQSPEEQALEEAMKDSPQVDPSGAMIEKEIEEGLFGHEEADAPKEIKPPPKKKSKKKKK